MQEASAYRGNATEPDLELSAAEPGLGAAFTDRPNEVRPVERFFGMNRNEQSPSEGHDVVTRSNEISPFLGPLSVSYMSRSPRQSAKTYQLERYRPDHGGPIDTREHGIEFIIFDPDHHPAPYRKLPSVTAHKHCQREPRSGETVDDY
jgi:hypothetical protein